MFHYLPKKRVYRSPHRTYGSRSVELAHPLGSRSFSEQAQTLLSIQRNCKNSQSNLQSKVAPSSIALKTTERAIYLPTIPYSPPPNLPIDHPSHTDLSLAKVLAHTISHPPWLQSRSLRLSSTTSQGQHLRSTSQDPSPIQNGSQPRWNTPWPKTMNCISTATCRSRRGKNTSTSFELVRGTGGC